MAQQELVAIAQLPDSSASAIFVPYFGSGKEVRAVTFLLPSDSDDDDDDQ